MRFVAKPNRLIFGLHVYLSPYLRKPVPTLYYSDHKQRSKYLEFKVVISCLMSAIAVERLLGPDKNKTLCASDELLIFFTITCCYGKRVTVFAVPITAGDSVKYQSFVYGSFVWEIHMRYNNVKYTVRNHVLQYCMHVPAKLHFQPYIRQYTSLNNKFEYS